MNRLILGVLRCQMLIFRGHCFRLNRHPVREGQAVRAAVSLGAASFPLLLSFAGCLQLFEKSEQGKKVQLLLLVLIFFNARNNFNKKNGSRTN